MNLPGKVVTRVFKFSLYRIHINRSQRLSSIVLSKTCCNSGSFIKCTGTRNDSFSIIRRKVHSIALNPTMGALSPLDPSSFSRPELAVVKHVSLSLTVDFDKKVLCGVAILNLDTLENITEVILDSSKLSIESVETEDGKSLKFCVGDEVPNYGSQLTVTLKDTAKFGDKWLWGECPVCVKPKKKIPNAKEDIKLAYKGFLYVPEFKIDEEKRRFRERQRDYFNAQCQCFYVKQVPELGPWDIVNRKISECSLQVPSKEEIFIAARVMHGKDNVKAKQGAIYVLGPNGSRHLITTYEELREVPQKCKDHAKEVAKAEALKPPVEKEKPHEKQKLALEKEIMILENKLAAEEAMAIPADIYDKSPLEKRIALEEKMATEKAMAVPAAIYESVDSLPDDVCEQLRLPKDMYPCSNETLPKHKMADQAERVQKLTIKIKYSTSPEASALAWLEPTQTSGKTHPYMFSQCQPIHARSIMPCQDTPAVKFTYDAQVTAPAEYTVLMSALRGEVNGTTTSFRQPMPLPAYLLAMAVGQIESKYLGPRSRVWSEQESLDKSAWEFAETERYLAAAEKLCGKYEWTEYDLLVLPPSFPYGGMENPCLTFVTPTLLAGDRSLADVIVHEIMHSWTGNLVTNRNFEHFWLNEGFTVYTERKVAASLATDPEEGKRIRDFASILGLQELTEAIESELGANNPLTQLVVNLNNTHPDDAFSTVPYEKGSLFLRYLEDLLGGPAVFDEFLRSYLSHFSNKSIDTNDFKSYLYKYFDNDARLNQVDWDTWLYKPGMPPVIPNYDTSMTKSVDDLVARIEKDPTFINTDVIGFTPQQMIYLLQKLVDGKPIPLAALPDLYNNYRLGESKNAEIMYRWVRICIRSKDKNKMDEYFNFVNSQGRMKYVRPIYRDLYAWEYARPMAIDNFLKNEKYMMHVSAYTLRKDLHLNES